MIDLLIEMFTTPGTPADPYERMSAAMGHGMVGVLLTAALLWPCRGRAWLAAVLAGALYSLWEAAQIVWSGSSVADSAIDLAAVACGAIIAAALWSHRLPLILPLALVLVVSGRLAPTTHQDHGSSGP